jgi:hypothetical protein
MQNVAGEHMTSDCPATGLTLYNTEPATSCWSPRLVSDDVDSSHWVQDSATVDLSYRC